MSVLPDSAALRKALIDGATALEAAALSRNATSPTALRASAGVLSALLAALPELKAALAWAEARLAYMAAFGGGEHWGGNEAVALWRAETDAMMRYVSARKAKEESGE